MKPIVFLAFVLVFLWLFLLTLFFFDEHAIADDGLVTPSIAYQKHKPPFKGITQLFMDLGITPPIHGFANPCIDLEQSTIRYCTPANVRSLVKKGFFAEPELTYFKNIMKSENVCILTGEYVLHICKVQNFMKIMDHFTFDKQGGVKWGKK